MSKATILFADNDPDFRHTRAEFLEQEGYQVIHAVNPTEVRRKLEEGGIDLAILDIRLVDDKDKKDISGLILAKETAPSIPKIILTRYPSVETAREALRLQTNGLPVAVDFVSLQEGQEAMLAAVRQALAIDQQVKERVGRIASSLSQELEKYFEEMRKQAAFTYRIGMLLLVVGGVFLIAAAVAGIWGPSVAAIPSAVSGVLVEGLAALFKKLSDDANQRMDDFLSKLIELYQLENIDDKSRSYLKVQRRQR